MRVIFISILIAASILHLSNSVVFADEKKEAPGLKIEPFVRYFPSRKAAVMPGSVSLREAGLIYSYEVLAFDKLPLEFSLDTQYIGLKNSTAVELPAHLTGLSAAIQTTLPFFNFDNMYFRLRLSPAFYTDDWNLGSSAFRLPQRYFLIYTPDEKWTFAGGINVYPDFETKFWPIAGFIYNYSEKLTFNMVPPAPNITYALSGKIDLFIEAGFSNYEFEVDKDNLENVVLRYRQTRLGSGIKYKFNKFIRVSILGGRTFNTSLKYKDSLGKVDIRDGLYTEIRAEILM